jgi:hypothetical protein
VYATRVHSGHSRPDPYARCGAGQAVPERLDHQAGGCPYLREQTAAPRDGQYQAWGDTARGEREKRGCYRSSHDRSHSRSLVSYRSSTRRGASTRRKSQGVPRMWKELWVGGLLKQCFIRVDMWPPGHEPCQGRRIEVLYRRLAVPYVVLPRQTEFICPTAQALTGLRDSPTRRGWLVLQRWFEIVSSPSVHCGRCGSGRVSGWAGLVALCVRGMR